MTDPGRMPHNGVPAIAQRALVEDLAELRSELAATRSEISALEQQLARARAELQKEGRNRRSGDAAIINELRPMIDGKRLDRQIRRGVRSVTQGVVGARRSHPRGDLHVVVLCPKYPGGKTGYGGEFVRTRVNRYVRAGLGVTVVVVDNVTSRRARDDRGAIVVGARPNEVRRVVSALRPDVLAVHHLLPETWGQIAPVAGDIPIAVWVHGYEARPWQVTYPGDIAELGEDEQERRTAADEPRRTTMRAAMRTDGVTMIYVSDYMRRLAEDFTGVIAKDGHVIHNIVDEDVFRYRPRRERSRRKILWVRTFSGPKYANDLARDAVLALHDHPVFDSLDFTIYGDGREFDEILGPIRRLPNVDIHQRFAPPALLAELMQSHGVLLAPTRWDSQGLTAIEAMSCGAVPVTNDISAVPEFISGAEGFLCPVDDPACLAESVIRLQTDPSLFTTMSVDAAARARRQCGSENTTALEIDLLRSLHVRHPATIA